MLASTRGLLQNTGSFIAPSVWFAATDDRLLFANTRSRWSYEYDEVSCITSSATTSGTVIDGSGYLHTSGTVAFEADGHQVTVIANRPIEAVAIVEAARQRIAENAATNSSRDPALDALILLHEQGLLTSDEYEQKRQSLDDMRPARTALLRPSNRAPRTNGG